MVLSLPLHQLLCMASPLLAASHTTLLTPSAPLILPPTPTPTPTPLQDEKLHDVLESIRGKFKAVVTTLGHLGAYLPKEAGADSLSF
jgi:hypothetical protein